MKSSTFSIVLLILAANCQGDEALSRVNTISHSNARVYSNSTRLNSQGGKQTMVRRVSNKSIQNRTVKITNRGTYMPANQAAPQRKPMPVSIAPVPNLEPVAIVDIQPKQGFDPANLSPELLKGFISALETEINSLNEEPVIEEKTLKTRQIKVEAKTLETGEEVSRNRLERLLQKMKEDR